MQRLFFTYILFSISTLAAANELHYRIQTDINLEERTTEVNSEFLLQRSTRNDVEKNILDVSDNLDNIEVTYFLNNNIQLNDEYIKENIRSLIHNYSSLLNWPFFSATLKPNIILFDNRKEFEAYQTEKVGEYRWHYGYYSKSNNEAVIFINDSTKDSTLTILHEVSHAINYQRIPSIPGWLNEGLAEYMSKISLIKTDDTKPVSKYNDSTLSIKKFLKRNYFNDRNVSAKQISNYYQISESLVAFLISKENQYLRRTLTSLEKLPFSLSGHYKEFDRLYPGGIDALAENWRQWANNPHEN